MKKKIKRRKIKTKRQKTRIFKTKKTMMTVIMINMEQAKPKQEGKVNLKILQTIQKEKNQNNNKTNNKVEVRWTQMNQFSKK